MRDFFRVLIFIWAVRKLRESKEINYLKHRTFQDFNAKILSIDKNSMKKHRIIKSFGYLRAG